MPKTFDLASYMDHCRQQIDVALSSVLPSESMVSQRLLDAMGYSVFNGGKRVRPLLAYAACEAVGGTAYQATPAACAVEFIHAYSLVHDDLPAMDDDDLRRGKPTCHKAFDEATAILVGDTLQTLAFETLSNPALINDVNLSDKARIEMIQTLSQASGLAGMAGGQAMDQLSIGVKLDQNQLAMMHSHKTGALINASVRMGALSHAQCSTEKLDQLSQYSSAIGLAFQVQDDILDVISDTDTLGKQQGADIALDKPTYVSLMGLDQAKAYAKQLHREAIDSLADFDDQANPLRQIADYIIHRTF